MQVQTDMLSYTTPFQSIYCVQIACVPEMKRNFSAYQSDENYDEWKTDEK